MATLHLVHGFNVSDGGKKTTSRLQPALEDYGHEIKIFDYGWVGLMGAWFLNPRIVRAFMERIEPGDSAVGHSNGCVIIYMATMYGAPLRILFYFAPALKRDLPVAPQVEHVHVIASENDSAVKFARWMRLLVPWAPLGDPLWGDMGAIGYGPDEERSSHYPKTISERFAHFLETFAKRNSFFRSSLKTFVGFPLAIIYGLLIAPVEILACVVKNNLRNPTRVAAINLKNIEDQKYVLFAVVIPTLFWLALAGSSL